MWSWWVLGGDRREALVLSAVRTLGHFRPREWELEGLKTARPQSPQPCEDLDCCPERGCMSGEVQKDRIQTGEVGVCGEKGVPVA